MKTRSGKGTALPLLASQKQETKERKITAKRIKRERGRKRKEAKEKEAEEKERSGVRLDLLHYDYLEKLFVFLSPLDLYNLSLQSRSLRLSVLRYLKNHPEKRLFLQWECMKIDLGRTITVQKTVRGERKRSRFVTKETKNFNVTKEDLSHISQFFRLGCEIVHFRARNFSQQTLSDLGDFVLKCASEAEQTLIFEADSVSLNSEELKSFFEKCSPVSLHFYGRFDRSIVSNEILPSTLQNLFIGEDLVENDRVSSITPDFFKEIVLRWKNTADLVKIPTPSYRICPIFSLETYKNHRQLDVDHCSLRVEDLHQLIQEMLTIKGVQQLIRFYNASLTTINDISAQRQRFLTMSNRILTTMIENDGMDANDVTRKSVLELRQRDFHDINFSNPRRQNFIHFSEKLFLGDEQIVGVDVMLLQWPQCVKAVLPEVIQDWTRL